MPNTDPIHLFWTGGMDSTFRLLELVLRKRRRVRPHYVIDAPRRSTGVELLRRDRIQALVRDRAPEAGELILPTAYHGLADIKPNAAISEHYNIVSRKLGMGHQHEWLAWLAAELGLDYMEICNHRNDPAVTAIAPFVVEARDADGSSYHCVDKACGNPAVFELFKFFRFPLFSFDKRELLARAKEWDFLELLGHAWTCHQPLGVNPERAKPCGKCNTCIYRINIAGLAGFPLASRARYLLAHVFRPRRIRALRKRQGLGG